MTPRAIRCAICHRAISGHEHGHASSYLPQADAFCADGTGLCPGCARHTIALTAKRILDRLDDKALLLA